MKERSTTLGSRLTSLMWRSLRRYGQIKYRYLLPVYRAFGLLRSQRKPQGISKQSKTLRSAQTLSGLLNRSSVADQLTVLKERIKESQGAVIFLPSVGWDVVNTQRLNHLAREFAHQGYVAIFDSSNSYDDVDGVREVEPNVFLFRGSADMLSVIPNPILWTVTYNFDQSGDYGTSARIVYDWIDDLDVFNYDRAFLERTHERALRDSQLVVCVAERLHKSAIAARPDALYLPNGVDFEHFSIDSVDRFDDPDFDFSWTKGRPLAGYYGAMAEWFDYELMNAVAGLRPDWNFLLIGPAYDNSLRERGPALLAHSNVRWIGPRGYKQLPRYLQSFDVAMIPFVINNITLATSPLKLYEYFAGAKPVVATPMPECEAFAEVHIARTTDEFSAALDRSKAQGKDLQFQERLRSLGRENSWSARVKLVLSHLQGTNR